MLLWSGVVLVAAAGLALSEDKTPPRTSTKANSSREVQTNGPKVSVKATADYPVVGYIEKRDRTIIVKAGPKGPVYSVKTGDGKVLYENLSKEQLSARAPELEEFLKTAVAGTAGGKADARVRARVDASIR